MTAMRFTVASVLLALALLLSGCVSSKQLPRPVPGEAVIAVVTPATEEFKIWNLTDPKEIVPIYGLVKMSQLNSGEAFIEGELAAQGFDATRELHEALMVALRSKGISEMVLVVPRPPKIVRNSKGRPRRVVSLLAPHELPPTGDAWAVLDTRLSYGLNAVFGGEFQPYVQLRARMVDAKTRATLYEQVFSYNLWGGAGVAVPLEGAARWDDVEAAKNDLPGVRAALAIGIARVSELVAADLATR